MIFKNKTLAQALWESLHTHSHETVNATLGALQLFFEAHEENAQVRDFFSHPQVSLPDKEKVIQSFMAFHKASVEAEQLLVFLIRQNKITQIPFILPLLRLMSGQHFKTASVQCKVATLLTESHKKLLEKELKEVLQMSHVELHETIDPEILGGIVLRMEGELFDASLKTKMRKIQRVLT